MMEKQVKDNESLTSELREARAVIACRESEIYSMRSELNAKNAALSALEHQLSAAGIPGSPLRATGSPLRADDQITAEVKREIEHSWVEWEREVEGRLATQQMQIQEALEQLRDSRSLDWRSAVRDDLRLCFAEVESLSQQLSSAAESASSEQAHVAETMEGMLDGLDAMAGRVEELTHHRERLTVALMDHKHTTSTVAAEASELTQALKPALSQLSQLHEEHRALIQDSRTDKDKLGGMIRSTEKELTAHQIATKMEVESLENKNRHLKRELQETVEAVKAAHKAELVQLLGDNQVNELQMYSDKQPRKPQTGQQTEGAHTIIPKSSEWDALGGAP